MVPREGTTHIILTHPMTLLDLPRHTLQRYCTSYGVTIGPTRGRRGLKLMHGVQHSCKEHSQSRVARLRHSPISNSLSIILSQWMVWILVFYRRVGPTLPQAAGFEPRALIPECNGPN